VFGSSVGDRVLLRYQLPLSELAGDFYSRLKSATQG
jgi:translation elongation factor EF-4